MKKMLCLVLCLQTVVVFAQTSTESADWKKKYRATATKLNDLVHTKLNASFDYAHSTMHGKEWVTLKPHFYPTDTLLLDAKGMDIHEISIVKTTKNLPLKYVYDGQ